MNPENCCFSLSENSSCMGKNQHPKKKRKSTTAEEALEKIIENSKATAEAYRKILDSLESKKNKN